MNLGNIAFGDVIGLETLRLGLRSDTLLRYEEPGRVHEPARMQPVRVDEPVRLGA